MNEILTKWEAGDATVAKLYCHEGVFNIKSALVAFYGTPAAAQLAQKLQSLSADQVSPEVRRVLLVPIIEDAWRGIQSKLTQEVVDLLVL